MTQEQADMLRSPDNIAEFIFHNWIFNCRRNYCVEIGRGGKWMLCVTIFIKSRVVLFFVDTNPGQGAEFKIILPLSLAVTEALLMVLMVKLGCVTTRSNYRNCTS